MTARHPSDPDNAAPDWMCISRGRFKDNSALASCAATRKWREALRDEMLSKGYVQLGKYAKSIGVKYPTLLERCKVGTQPCVLVDGNYWIMPGAVA